MATERRWSLSWVISDSRHSMTQITDEWWTQVHRHWWGLLARMPKCRTVQVGLRYFSIFDFFALCGGFGGRGSAGWRQVIATYDAATVLVTVTSQVMLRPSRYGIDVNPPGRFPSDLVNPCDSLTNGMPALVIIFYYYYYYYDKTNCENNNETDDRHSSLAINIKLKYIIIVIIMYVI